MSKQTATEWLFKKLWDEPKDKLTWYAILKQAEEMFEEQITDAWQHGFDWGMMEQSLAEQGKESTLIDAKHYYNETFKD
jgi:hypothetical protein